MVLPGSTESGDELGVQHTSSLTRALMTLRSLRVPGAAKSGLAIKAHNRCKL